MADEFEIHCDPYRINVHITGRPATGPFWFKVDRFSYPEERWNDFPLLILNQMLEALLASRVGFWKGIFVKARKAARIRFHDGPFKFNVAMYPECVYLFVLDDNMRNKFYFTRQNYISEVLRVSRSVLKRADELGFISDEIEKLSKSFKKVMKKFPEIKIENVVVVE